MSDKLDYPMSDFPHFDYEALTAEYGPFWPWLVECLFRHDPMGLDFGDNRDEYEAEAADILTRLPNLKNAEQVTSETHAIFTRWFDGIDVGREASYAALGAEVWATWNGGVEGLLDAIPGAWEAAQAGQAEAAAGNVIPLEDL